ncbi:putative Kinesin-like protein KIN-7I [Cocos nucifera]|nr:putative Kinesin-like protein KIN-7I [Cocos nucifera]
MVLSCIDPCAEWISDTELMSASIHEFNPNLYLQEALNYNKEKTKLRMQLRSMQAKLDALRGRYNAVMDEMGLMNKKFEEASTKLKKQLASYGVEILRLKKQLSTDE